MAPKIAILYYSTWGHIRTLALAVKAGVEAAGGTVDLYQIPETLTEEILAKMHAAPKAEDPIANPKTLTEYDAFLFGIPTRYGNFPAQWKAFWDATGGLLGLGRTRWQVRRCFCLHWYPRWWSGGYRFELTLGSYSSRYHLCAPWLCPHFPAAFQLGGGPRRLALGSWYFCCRRWF